MISEWEDTTDGTVTVNVKIEVVYQKTHFRFISLKIERSDYRVR